MAFERGIKTISGHVRGDCSREKVRHKNVLAIIDTSGTRHLTEGFELVKNVYVHVNTNSSPSLHIKRPIEAVSV